MVQLAELKKGDHFGETSLFASKSTNYLVDVIAEEPTEVLIINRKDLIEFFAENHRSSVKLLLYLMKKLNDRLEDLTEMYTNIRMKNINLAPGIKLFKKLFQLFHSITFTFNNNIMTVMNKPNLLTDFNRTSRVTPFLLNKYDK